MIRRWMRRRWFRDQAEIVRADGDMLAILYCWTPVPFWPVDHPSELEGVPHDDQTC